MREFYELVEDIRDVLAEKFLPSYSLENVYKTTLYSLIYAVLREKTDKYELLYPLERRIPSPLLAAAMRELVERMHVLAQRIDEVLSRPVLSRREADLMYVVENVKREIGSVEHVIVYDCMSLIEQIVISAFLRKNNIKSLFLNTIFLNPVGVTRFMTSQLSETKYRPSLRGVAQYAADKLNASLCLRNSFIDIKVHETGLVGVGAFVDKIDINRIAGEILNASINGRVLVFSDHGYDIVLSKHERYLYVVHGFKQSGGSGDVPLLLLSRISLFMRVG